MGVAYFARRSTHRLIEDLYSRLWSASEDGASCPQRYSSVIRITVASSMFTRRAGAGSAEARRARAG